MTEFIHPTSDWNQLRDVPYRKKELYSIENWGVDLNKQVLVGAPFGGSLAVTRDDKKLLLVTGASGAAAGKPHISIFTASGRPLSTFPYDSPLRLVKIGWTRSERLVCVFEDGSVQLYNLQGELVSSFSLGPECKQQGIVDAIIWPHGLVAMTTPKPKLQIFAAAFSLSEIGDPRVRRMAETGLDELPACWAVIEPRPGSMPELLLALNSGPVLLLSGDARQELANLSDVGGATRLAVSANGQIVAAFTRSGRLLVTPVDFKRVFSDFDTQVKVAPTQLAWCGEDAVLLHWDTVLLMVGPGADWLKFTYDEPLVIIPEPDGARIVTSRSYELLQKVPSVLEQTFRIGSTEPPAMLYDALTEFQKRSPRADELVRSIRDQLPQAVHDCVEAAGNEFNPQLQKQLLEAASFGKCFLTPAQYPSERFVEMCRILRVLNSVRMPEVGMPLTLAQYRLLGPEAVVDRLIERHQHALALRICDHLQLRQLQARVMVQWACAKVRVAREDAEMVRDEIVKRVGHLPGVSFAEIAATAWRAGRVELATRLLDHEARAAEQVPLLIAMKEDERALQKAIESGDTDLVYLVLLQLRRTRAPQEFISIVRQRPVAMNLLIAYARHQEPDLLRDLYQALDAPNDLAQLAVTRAYRSAGPDLEARLRGLREALAMYQAAGPKDANAVFAKAATEEQIRLLLVQKDLEATLGGHYVDLSLSDTLFNVMLAGDLKRAAKIRQEFKVPDRRFYHIKIKALAQMRLFNELEKFAKEKKPPVGFEAFADACLEQNQPSEAAKYIARISDPRLRADYYMRILYWREAAESAAQAKDVQLLTKIAQKAASADVRHFAEQQISMLRK